MKTTRAVNIINFHDQLEVKSHKQLKAQRHGHL
jgi:hypothetical protein